MKRQRILYIDTSIVGGFFDAKFEEAIQLLFRQLEDKKIIFVVSEALFDELEDAPSNVKLRVLLHDTARAARPLGLQRNPHKRNDGTFDFTTDKEGTAY